MPIGPEKMARRRFREALERTKWILFELEHCENEEDLYIIEQRVGISALHARRIDDLLQEAQYYATAARKKTGKKERQNP